MPGKPITKRPQGGEQSYIPKIGRPSVAQAKAIQEHILRAAQRRFLSEGYAMTSMEAIATDAGISKGTLYTRFSSKNELFRELVAERLQAWEDKAPGIAEQPDANLFDLLYRRGSLIIEAFRDKEVQAFSHLLFSETRHFPELAEDFRKDSHDRLVDELTNEIERFSKEGGWPTTDARGAALIFVSALTGWWAHLGYADIPKKDGEAYLARLIAVLTGGRAAF